MITSKDNEKIKYIKKLKQKKYRDKENVFLIFGDHLIEEAKKHGEIVSIFTSNENKEGILISNEIMKELNYTETPFDILAICKKVIKIHENNKILALADVQNPDNLGALIRSASAFGFTKILISNKTADIYNDKTIRASQGAIFHLDIKRTNLVEELKKLKETGYTIYATDVAGSSNPKIDLKSVLILGNEGSGVPLELIELSNELVIIKTLNVESLNVAIAGSILMYEWSKI